MQASASGAALPIDTARVSQAVLAEMARTRAPGAAAIGIGVGDRLVFARGYGQASTEQDAAVDPATLFRIGSVTKVITALAVLGPEQRRRSAARIHWLAVVRPYPNDASTWPGGSAFSSVNDLSRLAIALLNGGQLEQQQAIPVANARAVMTRQIQNAATDCGHTFRLGFCDEGRDTIISHYGFRSGTGAVFTLVPNEDVAVIILANTGGAIFFPTERAVLDMFGVQRRPDDAPTIRDIPARDFARIARTYVAGTDTLSRRSCEWDPPTSCSRWTSKAIQSRGLF